LHNERGFFNGSTFTKSRIVAKEKNVETAFISSTENVFYLTGFHTDPHERLLGLFVFNEAEPMLVCPSMEVGQAKEAGWKFDVIGYEDHQNPWELIKEAT